MLLRFGASQVRNHATVGGNLGNASPIADLPPMFLALNASVSLVSAKGERTIALQDYFIEYKKTALKQDEIIAELQFDQRALQEDHNTFRIFKISKRVDDDISTVCAAFSLTRSAQGSDVLTAAFGGMAAIPKRALALEQLVNNAAGSSCSDQQIAQALQSDFQPISDARASAAYRHTVACNLYRKFEQQVSMAGSNMLVFDYD